MIVLIIVAAVAIPVIVGPVLSLVRESTKPEKAITSNFLAQQKLEDITKDDFPDITIVTQDYTAVTGFSGYQWYWKVNYVDQDLNDSVSATSYKKITVKVKDPDNTELIYYILATKRVND